MKKPTFTKEQIKQYNAEDGDTVTISKIDKTTVVEVESAKNLKDAQMQGSKSHIQQSVKSMSKDDRVQRIKDLLAQDKTREEIKKTMYSEDVYKSASNPASVFASDWNSIK